MDQLEQLQTDSTNIPQINSTSMLQQALEAERNKSQKLAEANKALVEEFSKAGTYEEQMEIAKNALKDILPNAIECISHLIIAGESEGVRASLSKWAVDSVLSGKLDKNTDGTISDLLRQLADTGNNVPAQVTGIGADA